MIPLIGFCGASGSGKTTLLEGVIAQLAARGHKVGAIKHHGHAEPLSPEAPEKDSSRLAAAGAELVALLHAGGMQLSAGPQAGQWGPSAVTAGFMTGLDLVLVEGFKSAKIDKIEVVGPGQEPLLPPGGRLLAIAGRQGAGQVQGLPWLAAEDPAAVADFLLPRLKEPVSAQDSAQLEVDGRQVPLNPFVQGFLASTLRALVGSLKGGQSPAKMVIKIGE